MGKRQRRVLDGEIEKRACTAKKKDGTPCKRSPIKGGTVCMSHGGAAPQVRRKANERLLQGVPKMLSELKRLATEENMPSNVRLAAIRDWLDRAGIGESDKHELTINVPKWEGALEGVLVDLGDAEIIGAQTDDAYANANYPTRTTGVVNAPTSPGALPRPDDAPPRYTEPTP